MKIAYFTDTYLPQKNGVVTSILTFKEALEAKGHTVYIFAPKAKDIERHDACTFRFRNVPLPFHPEYSWVFPFSPDIDREEIRELDLDIIHIQTCFGLGLTGLRIAKKLKIPAIFTYHTCFNHYLHYLPGPAKFYQPIYVWYMKWLCEQFPLLISPTEVVKKELKRLTGTPIQVIPTGIPLDQLKVSATNIRSQWGIAKTDLLISTIGRLGKEKSFDLLIKSMALIVKETPNAKLMIIGNGPERDALEKLTDQLRLRSHIIFTGYVERQTVLDMLHGSDLFAFPSQSETQGLVVLEALGMGTPVVAVKALGPAEILSDEQGGLLCEATPEDMARKLQILIQNPALRAAKAQEAKTKITKFEISGLTDQLIRCYQSIQTKSRISRV